MNGPAEWMQQAIDLAVQNVRQGLGGPFGAVVVCDGVVVGTGVNSVTSSNDPAAHAEIMAIRAACQTLGSFQLTNCEIYTSCEPCPMCLGAIYWARPARIYFGCTHMDASAAGFDDARIFDDFALTREQRSIPSHQLLRDQAQKAFQAWQERTDKSLY